MTVSEIIGLFGGTSTLATALNVPVSTVDSWRKYNQVPRWRQSMILDLAARTNIALSTADFPAKSERAQAA